MYRDSLGSGERIQAVVREYVETYLTECSESRMKMKATVMYVEL